MQSSLRTTLYSVSRDGSVSTCARKSQREPTPEHAACSMMSVNGIRKNRFLHGFAFRWEVTVPVHAFVCGKLQKARR